MELRDEFIKAALTGFTAAIGPRAFDLDVVRAFDLDVVAKQCCEMADAVLRARAIPHKTQEQILKEASQAPDNAAKVHNNVEPAAWGVANCKGLILDATTVIRVAVEKQSKYAFDTELVPLYRSPTFTDAEREAIETAMNAYGSDNANPECAAIEATLWGLLERTK